MKNVVNLLLPCFLNMADTCMSTFTFFGNRWFLLWRHYRLYTHQFWTLGPDVWGSPAWKHIFTQDVIKAPWGSSINTSRYTSSVGVQHGKTHIHTGYKLVPATSLLWAL